MNIIKSKCVFVSCLWCERLVLLSSFVNSRNVCCFNFLCLLLLLLHRHLQKTGQSIAKGCMDYIRLNGERRGDAHQMIWGEQFVKKKRPPAKSKPPTKFDLPCNPTRATRHTKPGTVIADPDGEYIR